LGGRGRHCWLARRGTPADAGDYRQLIRGPFGRIGLPMADVDFSARPLDARH